MKITPVYHDGFVVELQNKTLVFDYWKGALPTIASDRPVYVFASHVHPDHFAFAVFSLFADRDDVVYVLSNDIHRKFNEQAFLKQGVTKDQLSRIRFLHLEETVRIDDLTIRTLPATDQGVAFCVETDDVRLYHAGDLNDWQWPKNTPKENEQEHNDYVRQIDKLAGLKFDAAFVPLDPRQEDCYRGGMDYFMRHTETKEVWPMHFFDHPEIIDRFLQDPVSEAYRDRIRIWQPKGV